jgi:hypothetical protein
MGILREGDYKMHDDVAGRPTFTARAGAVLGRAEALYLRVLRAVILIIATLLLAFAGWLVVSSVYKISRSTESVKEEPAVVKADELTDAQIPAEQGPASKEQGSPVNPQARDYYKSFSSRYYNLYHSKFEPYRQQEDKQLTLTEFDDSFLNTTARLEAVTNGDLNFGDDKADLEALLTVMTEAANKPATQQRLERYRTAKKVPTTRNVERTRTEYQRGWDSSSTSCSGWYEDPMGCAVIRPVQTTYTEKVTELQYPKGTQSHTQIFRAFQDRFFSLLQQRREANASKADHERQSILAGNADGKLSLLTALQLLGGFLVLMFFFLLIAIERHQRRISEGIRPNSAE